MENKFLHEIADWFVLIKAPDLKEKISDAILKTENGVELSDNQKKLLGFICFSYSMNRGPASFIGVEMVVKEIGVESEFKQYAEDWIAHSNKPLPSPTTQK